jgi:peptide-methionine (S)-S-oxide reductase
MQKDYHLETPYGHKKESHAKTNHLEVATFGAGCFWCVEAIFKSLKGVESVVSGYSGGDVDNPTYEEVCSGSTGHAEVCQIHFDPSEITYAELLTVFWQAHDPTTLNRQGPDVGTQYRSVIFFHNEQQKGLAEKHKKELEESGKWKNPIVTEITPYKNFFQAEGYHQNYYNQHSDNPYSSVVIQPKIEKLKKIFKDKVIP